MSRKFFSNRIKVAGILRGNYMFSLECSSADDAWLHSRWGTASAYSRMRVCQGVPLA